MSANSTTLKNVTLEMFTAPQETMSRYFRYDGSLTTPDCAEAVVWSLFEYAIPLSREQVFILKWESYTVGTVYHLTSNVYKSTKENYHCLIQLCH